MIHKITIIRCSIQEPMAGTDVPHICVLFVAYDLQKQLIVGVGKTPEDAVDHAADKAAMKFSIKKTELLALLRPIALSTVGLSPTSDSGDEDDIPF